MSALETGKKGARPVENMCPTEMFSFDAKEYKEHFSNAGYVHIKSGASPAFMDWIRRFAFETFDGTGLERFRIPDKKRQIRFPFPDDLQLYDSFRSSVAELTSLPRKDITLSESHIYFYDSTAASKPPPHKDRLASEVSLGIPIVAPEDSVVVLYPQASRLKNRYNSTKEWRSVVAEEEKPENATLGLEPIVLDARPGDVVAFLGSEIFHERWHAAGTVTFYVKFNSYRLDPLGEDPSLGLRHLRSKEALGNVEANQLMNFRIGLSPRVQSFTRRYGRSVSEDIVYAQVGSDEPIVLLEAEFRELRLSKDPITVGEFVDKLRIGDVTMSRGIARVRDLIRSGVLDIIPLVGH